MTAMPEQRRSNVVFLSLVGVAGAAIIAVDAFPGTEMRRNMYADRTACERDYSPQQCQPSSYSGGVSYVSYGYWSGPEYAANRGQASTGDPGPGRTGVHASTVSSVRGGFGGFGRSAHASS